MLYSKIIRPLLFRFPAEKAHHITFSILGIVQRIPGLLSFIHMLNQPSKGNEVELLGIKFPGRVGLAAGLDKDAKAVNALGAMGFGFIEVGTVTPRPQAGTPQPRLFRLPKDQALINRMGFNNEGLDAMVSRLKSADPRIIVGGNIGKNKDTPNEKAHEDYVACVRGLKGLVDYLVVNLSSPNTPGLRELQDKGPLMHLLSEVMRENGEGGHQVPVFLKVAPDITFGQADDIIDVATSTGISGLIISNTTVGREGLITSSNEIEKIGMGGLSGRPLMGKSTELLKYFKSKVPSNMVLIASGGIMDPKDAQEKIDAGASLVQLYTGFVYEGPSLVKRINSLLSNKR
ncbi:MAG: quinone-dependent dihydroorotate dehydrogenase [Bacteroidota bacterium]